MGKMFGKGGNDCYQVNFRAEFFISYNAEEVLYSGSTRAWWEYRYGQGYNEMALESESPGTSLCMSKAHCTGTSHNWNQWDQQVWVSRTISSYLCLSPLDTRRRPIA